MKMDKSLKRKAESASSESLKRPRASSNTSAPAKTSSENQPPQPPPQISFGVNPSPNAGILSAPLGGLPFHTWVNLNAVALFAQVDVSRILVQC
jgi:hypothetical protein